MLGHTDPLLPVSCRLLLQGGEGNLYQSGFSQTIKKPVKSCISSLHGFPFFIKLVGATGVEPIAPNPVKS